MTVDGGDLRRVAGRFPTGVTVVTSTHDGRPCGLTVNSFASVSLDPPLVLVCLSRAARAFACIDAAGHFAVNVLADGQERLARLFASTAADKFAGLDHRPSPRGDPILVGVHAWMDCDVVERHPGGRTHTIYVGRVTALAAGTGRPLLFHAGRYGALA
jgi:3-hydroxy-9,10-secoandrosta-1,3,5(10)-triene-9,17-dione monooxygenase reductase component